MFHIWSLQKLQARTIFEDNGFHAIGEDAFKQSLASLYLGGKLDVFLCSLSLQQIIMKQYHPNYQPYMSFHEFITFPVLGVHNGRVLSTDMGGP